MGKPNSGGDPFGGHLVRRQVVPGPEIPEQDKPENTLENTLARLRKATANKADTIAIENEMARIRNETARLDQEFMALRRTMDPSLSNTAPVAAAAIPQFAGTAKLLADIIELGSRTGLNVVPLLQQVITQPALNPAAVLTTQPAPPPNDVQNIPAWMGATMGRIVEKSLDNNQPKESAELAVLKERMHTQELMLNKELQDIKNAIRNAGDVKSPAETTLENIKMVGTLMSTIKAMNPEPPRAAPSINDSELAFRMQDRAWQHDEKKAELEVQKAEIATKLQIEREKLEERKNTFAQIPELIGGVVAESLMSSAKNKEAAPAAAPAPRKQSIDTLDIMKSKQVPHGTITIQCPECGKALAFLTSAPRVNCVSCGSQFKVVLHEKETGPTEVEGTAAQAQEGAAAREDIDFRRGQ